MGRVSEKRLLDEPHSVRGLGLVETLPSSHYVWDVSMSSGLRHTLSTKAG